MCLCSRKPKFSYDYEFRQCLNVICEQGNVLEIDGNIIVGISRSKKIRLEL